MSGTWDKLRQNLSTAMGKGESALKAVGAKADSEVQHVKGGGRRTRRGGRKSRRGGRKSRRGGALCPKGCRRKSKNRRRSRR